MMVQTLFESGIWSVGGLLLGYLVGGQLAEIRFRVEHLEEMEERREQE